METTFKCIHCQRILNNTFALKHIKKHRELFKNDISMYRYIICCKNSITEEQLDLIIKDYENNSVLYIEQTYNISFRSFVKNLGLKHKNISDSRKTNSCKERTKNTNNQKYGVDNISQSEHIKQKKKETFLKNYGVDNIWKLKEYRIEWEQKMIEKYGSPYIGNIHGNGNLWGWNNLESKISRINKHFLLPT